MTSQCGELSEMWVEIENYVKPRVLRLRHCACTACIRGTGVSQRDGGPAACAEVFGFSTDEVEFPSIVLYTGSCIDPALDYP